MSGDYPSPGNVELANASPEGVIFTWNPIAPVCPSIQYHINASNCGKCPTETTATLAFCNLQLSTERRICEFSVQSITCGTVGNQSNPLLASIGGTLTIHTFMTC